MKAMLDVPIVSVAWNYNGAKFNMVLKSMQRMWSSWSCKQSQLGLACRKPFIITDNSCCALRINITQIQRDNLPRMINVKVKYNDCIL